MISVGKFGSLRLGQLTLRRGASLYLAALNGYRLLFGTYALAPMATMVVISGIALCPNCAVDMAAERRYANLVGEDVIFVTQSGFSQTRKADFSVVEKERSAGDDRGPAST